MSPVPAPTPPPVPAEIEACFNRETPAPSGALDKAATIKLIGALRASEFEKNLCGKRMIGLYEDVQNGAR